MNIFSPYKTMEDSAKLCPNDTNVKLIIRHSLRPHIEIVDGKHQDVSLTSEGRMLARKLGASLELSLGSLVHSPHARCKQTCEEIINGFSEQNKTPNLPFQMFGSKIFQNSHVQDGKKCHDNFSEYGNEDIFKKYANGELLEGQYNLTDSVTPMLNCIFETGNKPLAIDIFCTHDFQMTLFLLSFFGCGQENQVKILEKWPQMLEGIFLWGKRNRYYAVWRGEKHEVKI